MQTNSLLTLPIYNHALFTVFVAGDVNVLVLCARLVCGLDHVNASNVDSAVRVRSGKEEASKDGFSFVVRVFTHSQWKDFGVHILRLSPFQYCRFRNAH